MTCVMTTISSVSAVKLYAQANMLARRFHMCTDDVKVNLFRAYCTPFYTAHLWCKYRTTKLKKLQVAYNDAFRIFLKLPRWTSASTLFVSCNVPTFHAFMRNFMYKFMVRLVGSNNGIISALCDTRQSDTRYFSEIWKHWYQCLYLSMWCTCLFVCFLFLCFLCSFYGIVLSFLYGTYESVIKFSIQFISI